jgi:pyruvate dehydrogenase E2 component (dihydrolipoamide acetyltransferase)
VDLAAITGTGRHGVVRLEDLPHTPAPAVGTPTAPLDAVDPAARMRAAIASAMSLSKREIPHYYLTHTVELSAALAFLEAHNASRPPSARALPAALFLRAIALALRKHPELNAHWVDGRAVPRDTIDLGLAISLRGGGLVAPSIREADTLDLDALMAALTDLVERARSGTLRASTMAPGSLTVTSLGERGVDVVVPVILPPQVAMVGIGAITTRPWVVGDACLPRPVVTLSLAADHRVTDGHVGARFLARIASLLVPS